MWCRFRGIGQYLPPSTSICRFLTVSRSTFSLKATDHSTIWPHLNALFNMFANAVPTFSVTQPLFLSPMFRHRTGNYLCAPSLQFPYPLLSKLEYCPPPEENSVPSIKQPFCLCQCNSVKPYWVWIRSCLPRHTISPLFTVFEVNATRQQNNETDRAFQHKHGLCREFLHRVDTISKQKELLCLGHVYWICVCLNLSKIKRLGETISPR